MSVLNNHLNDLNLTYKAGKDKLIIDTLKLLQHDLKQYKNWSDDIRQEFVNRHFYGFIINANSEVSDIHLFGCHNESHKGKSLGVSASDRMPVLIKINLPQPYSKSLPVILNKYNIPEKEFYSTDDVCAILKIAADTFRARLRNGHYQDVYIKRGGKRIYTMSDIEDLIIQTEQLKKNHKVDL